MNNVTPNKKQSALALLVISGLSAWMSCRTSDVAATPPLADAATLPASASATADAGVAVLTAVVPAEVPTTATLVFSISPSVHATVSWGKKRLGVIAPGKPLVVVRPRDSGPLDVVVRAEGYLPVHTRANTFSDTKVMVKLTKPDATQGLIGYRVPIDAGVPLGPDGLPVVDPALLAPPDQPMF